MAKIVKRVEYLVSDGVGEFLTRVNSRAYSEFEVTQVSVTRTTSGIEIDGRQGRYYEDKEGFLRELKGN